jgi:hypothetical protein
MNNNNPLFGLFEGVFLAIVGIFEALIVGLMEAIILALVGWMEALFGGD